MMSSSSILKSNAAFEGSAPEGFVFGQISLHSPPKIAEDKKKEFAPSFAEAGDESSRSFTPMSVFDDLLTPGEGCQDDAEPEEALPPTVTIAEEELESRLRESYESGLEDGRRMVANDLASSIEALREAAKTVVTLRNKALRESEEDILKLVMMIARKVILREASVDEKIVIEVIRNAIDEISDKDEIIVNLNPDDLAMVSSSPDFLPEEMKNRKIHFRPDPEIRRGSCNVYTDMGKIEADFDSQIDEVYRHLIETANSR